MYHREKNILILGETGVGKSTWINAFANYLYFDSLEKATMSAEKIAPISSQFSFTMDNGESKDILIGSNDGNETFSTGQSATQEPQTHTFVVGETVINIIDTPGTGDPRGIDQDKKNFDNILGHISHYKDIHAICILLKPNESKLTVLFRFCIQELLVHLHNDAARNIVFCFTHARGNFYRPGDTLPPLRKELKDRNVGIELNQSNLYCFDSEAFRFLACVNNGIIFPREDAKVFSSSWNRAVLEKNRLLQHIYSLNPHKVVNTLTLNDARRIIVTMSRPLAEMTLTIQKNIQMAAEALEEANVAGDEVSKFEQQLRVEGVDLVFDELDFPRTVCTHNDCIEFIPAGRDELKQVNYKQHCHPHCYVSGVPVETVGDSRLQNCWAMKNNSCHVCGHSYNVHMHRTYDLQQVKRVFIDLKVQAKIDLKVNQKDTMDKLNKKCRELVNEFEQEQKDLLRISATYGSFLKQVAIIPYNDAVGDYLDMVISQESKKDKLLRDQDLINKLIESRNAYGKEKQSFDSVMARGNAISTSQRSPFEPGKIKGLQDQLFSMKHFGNSLRKMFESIEDMSRCHIYKQKKLKPIVGRKISHSMMGKLKEMFNY